MKAAVSRLPFGPEPKGMEVTDIATGHFVFAPVEGEKVSYEALDEAITDAGYEIEDAAIAVSGTVTENRHLETPDGHAFHLTAVDEDVKNELSALEPGTDLRVEGAWVVREGAEVVVVQRIGEETAAGEEQAEERE